MKAYPSMLGCIVGAIVPGTVGSFWNIPVACRISETRSVFVRLYVANVLLITNLQSNPILGLIGKADERRGWQDVGFRYDRGLCPVDINFHRHRNYYVSSFLRSARSLISASAELLREYRERLLAT